MAADRHLMFGLLALQNGVINQVQLLHGFQAWTLDKTKSLADHLLARGDLSAAKRALIEALAEVHLEVHDGNVEKSLAAISAGKSTRESLAKLGDPDIEGTLGHVASAHGSTDSGDADRTASYAVGTATSDGQRFRVLRPHARGGLGAVFVALDSELNREVVLKQILDHHADDATSRQRFLLEAEVTGGLEHPGIVPVYGLGSYADGRPYYAMRFIRGDSLKAAIEQFHSSTAPISPSPLAGEGRGEGAVPAPATSRDLALRKLLRRFTDVCNAIQYAHDRGVLHRDIKPGNIIVGKHGETLVVDWGLAKATGRSEPGAEERTLVPSSASGSAETLPGSALGTPAYMSPEQARGDLDQLGSRSDVYSLGATLHCLLTGKPPQEGDDIGEVLRRVQRGEFTPPRQLDPAIDKALEAVCLKAMAAKPEDRYASCRALADDIERWMADEPVAAWKEPWTRSLTRWLARHRTGVTAAGAAGLAALIGLAAVLGTQRQSNAVLAAKNTALDQANVSLRDAIGQKDAANAALADANTQVQARFDLAREAIRSFKAGVEEEEALKEDRLRTLRDKLLGSARRFYDRLGELLRGHEDAASKAILAESYAELGELIDKIGQKPEALETLKKAVAIRRELAATPGAGAAERVALARALSGLGDEALALGDHAGSLAAHEEAGKLAEPLAAGPGAMVEARRALGAARQGAGAALEATGKDAATMAAFRQALLVREALTRDASTVPDDRLELAYTVTFIGRLLERTGDLAGALAEQRRYQDLMRALAAEHPAVPDYRRDLAVSYNWVGNLLEKTGDLAGALAEHRKNLGMFRALAAEHPAVSDYRRNLAVSHTRVGNLLEKTGDTAGALAEHRKYQDMFRALAAEHPAVPDYRSELAVSHNKVGNLLEKTGDTGGALAEQRRYQDLMRALAAEHPAVPDYRRDLAVSHTRVGNLLEKTGELGGALAEQRRCQELMRALAAEHPAIPDYRYVLAISHTGVGRLLEQTGDLAGALAEQRRYQDLMRALASEHPAVPDYRRGLAVSHTCVGNLLSLALLARPAEALDELEHACSLLEALVRSVPSVPDYRDYLALALKYAAAPLLDLGRIAEARERLARAVAQAEALSSAEPQAPGYRIRLADALRRLARLKLDAGDAAGAAADARRAVALLEGLPMRNGPQHFSLACARVALAAAFDREGPAPSADAALADRAMDDLRRAAAMGYRNPAQYHYEPALGPLRPRADFRLLLLDLAFPSDPFAR